MMQEGGILWKVITDNTCEGLVSEKEGRAGPVNVTETNMSHVGSGMDG